MRRSLLPRSLRLVLATAVFGAAFAGPSGDWLSAGRASGLRSTLGGAVSAAERTESPIEFRDGDRVVWIGATFVERMQQDNYLECLLSTAFASKKLTFRNLGWSGDTVGGESRGVFGGPNEGFARLVKDAKETKPTLLMVQYGSNEAMRGSAGVGPFVAGLDRLLDALADTQARVVLVSPCPREKVAAPLPDPAPYNRQLSEYENALRETAARRGCGFVSLADLYQAVPTAWRPASETTPLTYNGMHFSDYGSFFVAQAIAAKLGAASTPWELRCDVKDRAVQSASARVESLAPEGKAIVDLKVQDLRGPTPPAPPAKQGGPATGRPRAVFVGLAPGKYRLLVDGVAAATADAQQWAAGVTLDNDARVQRAELLRRTIRDKNELYFHRHRPQNETYLFLFRKHEQGRNAVEIPQFDPLVAEKETQIFELSQPIAQRWQLVPAE